MRWSSTISERPTSLGIATDNLLHTALAVLDVSAILMASVVAFTIMKCMGAAYLVYWGESYSGSKPFL